MDAVEEKPTVRKPVPPFTTSTLQQEANRKLRLSARETMRCAQGLYERGFITYMRTDSVHLSDQAINASSQLRGESLYGKEYLSKGRGSSAPKPAMPRRPMKRFVHPAKASERQVTPVWMGEIWRSMN